MGEVRDTPVSGKPPLFDRFVHDTLSHGKAIELAAAQILMGLEIAHDMRLYPTHHDLRLDQVGTLPNPATAPAAAWAVDHIGDIWEIGAGFTALRVGFVAANEILQKEPIKKLVKGYQIPDEACFWASLTTTVTVKAAHSLGQISLFHIHDHMGNPIPEMIFGQGIAAVVLAASHYAAKYREPIKNLALRVEKKVIEGAKVAGRNLQQFEKKMDAFGHPDVRPDIAVANDRKEIS